MIVNANSIVQQVIQIKNGIMKGVSVNVKNYRTCKEDYSWDPNTYIYENNRHLKSIADTSVITCDEIRSVMDIASTKLTML